MAGRSPTLNWTKSRKQYTVTLDGKFYLLGSDREAADQHFRFLLNKHDLAETVSSNPAFVDVADQWLEYVEKNHDPNRYRLCKARLQEFISFVGASLKVQQLRVSHVERWLATRTLKPGTIRLYKATILAVLNWAAGKKVRLIPNNPIRGLLELPEGGSRGGEVVWPRKVLEQVLKVSNPAFANVVRILAWTGSRPSTICQIEASHYLPQLKLWDVESIYRSRRSNRKYVKRIWLCPQAVKLVDRLNTEHPSGPIFRNAQGTPWNSEALGIYLYQLQHKFKASKKLHWPDGLCLYGLRHTFATNFIKEHPDKLEYLREILGHKDMTMIRKHYGHLFDEHAAIHEVLDSMRFSVN